MAREYFNAYHSYLKSIETLNDAEIGRLFVACLTYSMSGTAQELRGNERHVFPMIRSQIDRDAERYAEKCAVNRANGALGGQANATERHRTLPNAPQTPPKEKEKEKEITPLNPPEGKSADDIAEIVDYLNEKTGSSFKASTASTRKQIGARLKEGYTVEDCKRVIDDRVKLWKETEWEQYLRPDTLFRPSKFEGYLNAAPKEKPPDDWRKEFNFYDGG